MYLYIIPLFLSFSSFFFSLSLSLFYPYTCFPLLLPTLPSLKFPLILQDNKTQHPTRSLGPTSLRKHKGKEREEGVNKGVFGEQGGSRGRWVEGERDEGKVGGKETVFHEDFFLFCLVWIWNEARRGRRRRRWREGKGGEKKARRSKVIPPIPLSPPLSLSPFPPPPPLSPPLTSTSCDLKICRCCKLDFLHWGLYCFCLKFFFF